MTYFALTIRPTFYAADGTRTLLPHDAGRVEEVLIGLPGGHGHFEDEAALRHWLGVHVPGITFVEAPPAEDGKLAVFWRSGGELFVTHLVAIQAALGRHTDA